MSSVFQSARRAAAAAPPAAPPTPPKSPTLQMLTRTTRSAGGLMWSADRGDQHLPLCTTRLVRVATRRAHASGAACAAHARRAPRAPQARPSASLPLLSSPCAPIAARLRPHPPPGRRGEPSRAQQDAGGQGARGRARLRSFGHAPPPLRLQHARAECRDKCREECVLMAKQFFSLGEEMRTGGGAEVAAAVVF